MDIFLNRSRKRNLTMILTRHLPKGMDIPSKADNVAAKSSCKYPKTIKYDKEVCIEQEERHHIKFDTDLLNGADAHLLPALILT